MIALGFDLSYYILVEKTLFLRSLISEGRKKSCFQYQIYLISYYPLFLDLTKRNMYRGKDINLALV